MLLADSLTCNKFPKQNYHVHSIITGIKGDGYVKQARLHAVTFSVYLTSVTEFKWDLY